MTDKKIFSNLLRLEKLQKIINDNLDKRFIYYKNNEKKYINNIEILKKYIQYRITLYNEALLWNNIAINKLNDTKILNHPYILIDDNNIKYEIRWILFDNLNYRWKKFDKLYKWSLKLNYYINWLNQYIQKICSIKQARIKVI